MEYLEVGEIREIGRVKVQCLESYSDHCGSIENRCECAFFKYKHSCKQLACMKDERGDYNNVYFKKAE